MRLGLHCKALLVFWQTPNQKEFCTTVIILATFQYCISYTKKKMLQ